MTKTEENTVKTNMIPQTARFAITVLLCVWFFSTDDSTEVDHCSSEGGLCF